MESGNQWAPRLGASWDVFGDASLKVFGNLGRYYLALPNSVAIRGASPSIYTREYFTYTGIDPVTGVPTGLKPIGPGPVSVNREYGRPPNPNTVASTDLRSQYQDEGILGFQKQLGSAWVTGATLTVRKLQSAIDDVCDPDALDAKMTSMGLNPALYDNRGCYIFNPGRSNTFQIDKLDGSGSSLVTMSNADWGFTSGVKRKYYALNMFLEHPFDGKWQARLDYTFSRSYGNTEGQVRSDIGQTDVSKTQDWDSAALMTYSNGVLTNDRMHQIRFFGAYQLAREWMASAVMRVVSGAPKNCLGYYGANQSDPTNYGSYYHYCFGEPSRPGDAGRWPWTKQLDLGLSYRPDFAKQRLAFGLNVFNVLDQRDPVQGEVISESAPRTVKNTYGMGAISGRAGSVATPTYTTPRYVRLSVTYDI